MYKDSVFSLNYFHHIQVPSAFRAETVLDAHLASLLVQDCTQTDCISLQQFQLHLQRVRQ